MRRRVGNRIYLDRTTLGHSIYGDSFLSQHLRLLLQSVGMEIDTHSDSREDLVHPGTSAPRVQKKLKFVLLSLKKSKTNIRECIHTYYIFLQSFGEKYLLFWSIEKNKFIGVRNSFLGQKLSFFRGKKYNVFFYEIYNVHCRCPVCMYQYIFFVDFLVT